PRRVAQLRVGHVLSRATRHDADHNEHARAIRAFGVSQSGSPRPADAKTVDAVCVQSKRRRRVLGDAGTASGPVIVKSPPASASGTDVGSPVNASDDDVTGCTGVGVGVVGLCVVTMVTALTCTQSCVMN